MELDDDKRLEDIVFTAGEGGSPPTVVRSSASLTITEQAAGGPPLRVEDFTALDDEQDGGAS